MIRLLLYSLIAPTKLNNFKAYSLRIWFLVPVTSLLVGLHGVTIYSGWQRLQVKGSFSDLTPAEIVRLTNKQRQEAGLNTLRSSPLLAEAAQAKAESMIEAEVFDHYYQDEESQTTVSPWQFVDEQDYEFFFAGENLGKDFFRSTDLVQAWMDSPTHRDNLLNPDYTEIGVAVIIGPYLEKQETSLIVQLFATPMEEALAANPDLLPDNSGQINLTPLLEGETSWSQSVFQEYPEILWYGTAGIVILVGVSLLLEAGHLRRSKQVKKPEISIELWRS